MKRSRFLALILVVAVMMMGAGYAYWTQELTIENTITTGVLEVKFSGLELTVDEYMDEDASFFQNVDEEYHALELFLAKAYPSAEATVEFELVNGGTLAANVRGFAVEDGAVGVDFVLCHSLSLDGVEVAANVPLAQALEVLNNQDAGRGVFVEFNDKVAVEMVLQIDPDANSIEDSPMYLVQDCEEAITFTINAMVHQYNDR